MYIYIISITRCHECHVGETHILHTQPVWETIKNTLKNTFITMIALGGAQGGLSACKNSRARFSSS